MDKNIEEEVINPIVPEKEENTWWELIKFAFLAFIIVVPLRMFVAQPFIVSGASMYPTFDDKEYLIVDEISYHLSDPSRGDVAIFRYPKDPSKFFIKRVIGLPGDTIDIQNGKVTITNTANPNGLLLNEPYVKNISNETLHKNLSDSEYFVLGDNRTASSDSRSWGTLQRKLFVGRALLRILPIAEASFFPGDYRNKQ
ncbi:MAG: signal peptidase I [Candidatus Paceibacterota bacterium]|jgi:signal peptidase I